MMNAHTQVFALLLLICVQYSLAMTAKHGKGASETPPCHARCEHGTCVYTCVCNEGYTGETCSEEIDGSGCDCGYGTCDDVGNCVCDDGYTGEDCMEPIEGCPPCENGSCVVGSDGVVTCECVGGYSGDICQHPPPPETEKVCQEKPVKGLPVPAGSSMNQFAGFNDCINKFPITRTYCVGACKDTDDICQGVEFKQIGNIVYCDRGSADQANWKQFTTSNTVITKCGCKEKGGNNLMTERRCALRMRVVNRGDDDREICDMDCDNHAAYTLPYCGGTCDDRLRCGVVKGSEKSIAVVYDCPGGKQVTITMSVPTACDCN